MEVSSGLKQSRGGLARRFPARKVARGRAKWGKRMRGSSRTCGWFWFVGRWSEEAGRRWTVAGGEPAPRRGFTGGDGVGDLGRGASVEVWGGGGGVKSGNVWVEDGGTR